MRITWLRISCLLILALLQQPSAALAGDAKQGSENSAAAEKKSTGNSDKKSSDKKAGEDGKKSGDGKKSDEMGWEEFLDASRKSYAAGKLNEAANELDLALASAERLKADVTKAYVFLKLCEQYIYLKQFERAKALIEEGISLKRKIPGFKSVSSANSLDNLAQAYLRTGDAEGASRFEKEALATYESLHKTDTHDYAIALANQANTLRQLKQNKEAEQCFAKAVTVQQKVDKGDSIELAKILLNAGGLYCDMNRLDSAKRLLDRAARIIHAKVSPEHPLYKLSIKGQRIYYKKLVDELLKKDPNPIRSEVGQAVTQLASMYDAEGDTTQAAAAYKQAVSIEEKLLPADSPELKKIRDDYAACAKKITN